MYRNYHTLYQYISSHGIWSHLLCCIEFDPQPDTCEAFSVLFCSRYLQLCWWLVILRLTFSQYSQRHWNNFLCFWFKTFLASIYKICRRTSLCQDCVLSMYKMQILKMYSKHVSLSGLLHTLLGTFVVTLPSRKNSVTDAVVSSFTQSFLFLVSAIHPRIFFWIPTALKIKFCNPYFFFGLCRDALYKKFPPLLVFFTFTFQTLMRTHYDIKHQSKFLLCRWGLNTFIEQCPLPSRCWILDETWH